MCSLVMHHWLNVTEHTLHCHQSVFFCQCYRFLAAKDFVLRYACRITVMILNYFGYKFRMMPSAVSQVNDIGKAELGERNSLLVEDGSLLSRVSVLPGNPSLVESH